MQQLIQSMPGAGVTQPQLPLQGEDVCRPGFNLSLGMERRFSNRRLSAVCVIVRMRWQTLIEDH